MKNYRLFASAVDSVEMLPAAQAYGHALETSLVSKAFSMQADSWETAYNAFLDSKEFDSVFSACGKATAFYLDDKGFPHLLGRDNHP